MIVKIKENAKSQYSVVLDDDGRVGYAYLLNGNSIVADVWLYNRCDTPVEPEWRSGPAAAPFANPQEFCMENELGPVDSPDQVEASWAWPDVVINIHGRAWAILRDGTRPGRCRLAKKNGPLARIMESQ